MRALFSRQQSCVHSRGMCIRLSVTHVFRMYSTTGGLCSLVCRVRGLPHALVAEIFLCSNSNFADRGDHPPPLAVPPGLHPPFRKSCIRACIYLVKGDTRILPGIDKNHKASKYIADHISLVYGVLCRGGLQEWDKQGQPIHGII